MDFRRKQKCIENSKSSVGQWVQNVLRYLETQNNVVMLCVQSNVEYGSVFKDVPDNEIAPGYTETIWMPMGVFSCDSTPKPICIDFSLLISYLLA